MSAHFDSPFVVFAIALIAQTIAAYIGDFFRKRAHSFKQGERHDFNVVQAATLTLLALIIGFTFSMAVTRYDERKTLEEAEANAIGTEYLRADLLPGDSGARTRDLLRKYLDLRIAFYEQGGVRVAEIDQQTARVQGELWAVVGGQPADADDGARSIWNERCAQLAGLYAGGLVESDTHRGMGNDGDDGDFVQPAGWLRRASKRGTLSVCLTDRNIRFVFSDRRP